MSVNVVGQECTVIGNYNAGMVCYALMNFVSVEGMLMVGCRCGVGVENVVTMTALTRRIDEVEGEWCHGVGHDQLLSLNSTPYLQGHDTCHLLPG